MLQMYKTEDVSEYAHNLKDKMEQSYNIARKHSAKNTPRQKRHYDTRVIDKQLKVGDIVLKRNPLNKKLESPWVGPYIVLRYM